VAVFAAALLAVGPWTPLANIGLGSGCAAAATDLHVGVVIDYSGIPYRPLQTGCAPWLTGRTAIDELKLAFPKANVQLTADGTKVCMIDTPSGACAPNPPGTWVFGISKGDGSWTPNHDPQNVAVPNGSVVGWKYVAGTPSDQMPAAVPDISKICAPAASPTPTPTPTKTPTPAATNNQTTTTPGSGSNPNTNNTTPTLPNYPPPTQPGPNQPGVPGVGDTGSGSGIGDPGVDASSPPPLNANPVASTYDTRGWTQWGLILVAAGFALVMVTGGLFTSNMILSRRATKKGKHRRSSRLAI
jgi:hypothetical protein